MLCLNCFLQRVFQKGKFVFAAMCLRSSAGSSAALSTRFLGEHRRRLAEEETDCWLPGPLCSTWWMESAAIYLSCTIITNFVAGSDWKKERMFAELQKSLETSNKKTIVRKGESLESTAARFCDALASLVASEVFSPLISVEIGERILLRQNQPPTDFELRTI